MQGSDSNEFVMSKSIFRLSKNAIVKMDKRIKFDALFLSAGQQ